MSLFKTRPQLVFRCPQVVRPGEELVVQLETHARRPVPAKAVTVSLIGEERVTIGAGEHATTERRSIVRLRAVPAESVVLEGSRTFACSFRLPPDAPPTYVGMGASIEYRFDVRVNVPWWPDAKASYLLAVTTPPLPAEAGEPVVTASNRGGPQGTSPYVELSLDRDAVVPGEVIMGAVAVSNVAWNKYKRITVELIGRVHRQVRRSTRDDETVSQRFQIPVDPATLADGQMVPFSLPMPHVTPSFAGQHLRLDWILAATAHHGWSGQTSARLALRVGPDSPARKQRPRTMAPAVGDARQQRMWAQVAERHALAFDGSTLRGSAGGVAFSIGREHRGAQGWKLVAALGYRSLGLGLSIGRAGFGDAFRRKPLKIGHTGWDGDHRITARSVEQASPLVQLLRKALPSFHVPHLDDDDARVEIASQGDQRSLEGFVAAVTRLATAIDLGRERIPLPAWFAGDEPGWVGLASRLGGTLQRGTCSIHDGKLEGGAVHLEHVLGEDGGPLELIVAYVPAKGLAVREPRSLLAGDGQLLEGDLPAAQLALLQEAQVRKLELDKRQLTLHCWPPSQDAAFLEPVLAAVQAVARGFEPRSGAFR